MLPTLTQQASKLFGIELTPEQESQYAIYSRELVAWNAHTNLTAITEPAEVEVRHFLDSLSVVKGATLRPGMRVIDVGAGAGFPGLALRIAFPQIYVMLLEATGKKVTFMQHIITTLGLSNTETLHARAEEAGQMPAHRARYDLVLARAVARLPSLVEYLLPLAKVGGRCIAMKGKTAEEEARDAARALTTLGGKLHSIETVTLPGVEETHYLVVMDKIGQTPKAYPRRPGIPAKKPLG